MTMYYNAGLNVMHMILHVVSECYVRDVTRGRMWRIIVAGLIGERSLRIYSLLLFIVDTRE